jgi:hypothetical protein
MTKSITALALSRLHPDPIDDQRKSSGDHQDCRAVRVALASRRGEFERRGTRMEAQGLFAYTRLRSVVTGQGSDPYCRSNRKDHLDEWRPFLFGSLNKLA